MLLIFLLIPNFQKQIERLLKKIGKVLLNSFEEETLVTESTSTVTATMARMRVDGLPSVLLHNTKINVLFEPIQNGTDRRKKRSVYSGLLDFMVCTFT